MSLENKLKKEIEKKKLIPIPKWNFVMKEWFVWVLGILSVVIGGLIVSATLFYIKNTHWGLHGVTHESFFDFLLEFLPFIWIILFAVFVFTTYKFLRKTRKGYKYNFVVIVFGVFFLTILTGIISFNFGVGYIVENKLGPKIPFYKDIETREKMIWDNFDKGFFLGVIKNEGEIYYLETKEGIFEIFTGDLPEHFEPFFDIDEDSDDMVRIVGNLMEGDVIYPCMIFPFEIMEREFFGGKEFIIKNEINPTEMRINNCKGVRPYRQLILTR